MAKRIIECSVNDEYVSGAGVVVGAAGSHDDVVLRLTFDEYMWGGLNIYATFRNSYGESPTVTMLMPSMLVDGSVMTYDLPVPAAAKRLAGKMQLVLSGYAIVNDVQVDTATNTATAFFRVLASDFAMLDDGSVDATLAQQLQGEINEFGRIIAGFGDRLDEQDSVIGDVSSALDEIHVYAQSLIGGNGV